MPESRHIPVRELERRFLEAAARGINRTANVVMADAIQEAPLGPAADAPKEADGVVGGEGHIGGGGSGELRGSAHGPINDPDSAATAGHLEAEVSFRTPYAAAQHEGIAVMRRGDTEYVWKVRQYTTPGTKKKFLADPLKAQVHELERRVAEEIAKDMR